MTDQPHAEFWVIPTTPVASSEGSDTFPDNPELIAMLETRWNEKSETKSKPESPNPELPAQSKTPFGLKELVMTACREVYAALQGGHSEAIYGKALEVEFRQKQLLYETQVHLPVYYKGSWIGYVVPDFILSSPFTGEQVVLELKSVATDVKRYHHQLRKYQQAMPEATILCINFGPDELNITDFVAEEIRRAARKPIQSV